MYIVQWFFYAFEVDFAKDQNFKKFGVKFHIYGRITTIYVRYSGTNTNALNDVESFIFVGEGAILVDCHFFKGWLGTNFEDLLVW